MYGICARCFNRISVLPPSTIPRTNWISSPSLRLDVTNDHSNRSPRRTPTLPRTPPLLLERKRQPARLPTEDLFALLPLGNSTGQPVGVRALTCTCTRDLPIPVGTGTGFLRVQPWVSHRSPQVMPAPTPISVSSGSFGLILYSF
jgi:hypothetical protein